VFAVAETLVTVNNCKLSFAGPVLSFAAKSMAERSTCESSFVLAASSVATGASLTSVTVMFTVDVFES